VTLGWGRIARATVVFACAAASLAPLFVSRDVPLVDLPAHLGAVDIWNRYSDPATGYAKYYLLHIRPAPYWPFYGFLHFASYLVPLRIAAKIFMALTMLGVPLGLRAWIRAHGGPAVLALAGFPIAWSASQTWGFLALTGGTGLLLYSYALLARLDDARPWPSRGLLAANVAMGPLLLVCHPLLFILWLPALLVYARRHLVVLALPSFVLLAAALAGGPERRHIDGSWRSLGSNLKDLFFTQVVALWDWRARVLEALALALLLAFVLAGRRRAPADRRPLAMFAALLGVYLVLPFHLDKPIIFAGMNVRVEVFVALAAFVLVDNRLLDRWRQALVALPLVVISIVFPLTIAARFAAFGDAEKDFYAVVEHLPNDPALATLIYVPKATLGWPAWSKFAAYARLERGGFDNTLWDATSGVGSTAFPATYRPGAGRPVPPLDAAETWSYDAHAKDFEYFLTQFEPKDLFSRRPELRLVAESGPWRLWQRR